MKKICTLFLIVCFAMTGRGQSIAGYTFSQNVIPYTPITGGTNWPSVLPVILDDDFSGLSPIGFTFRHGNVDFTEFSINANGYIALGEIAHATSLPDNFAALSDGVTPNHVIAALNNDLQGTGQIQVDLDASTAVVIVVEGGTNHISVGDVVKCDGVPPGTTVIAKGVNTITLSANPTVTEFNRVLRFVNANTGIRYETVGAAPNRKLIVQWTGFGRQTSFGSFGELYNFQVILYETTNVVEIVYNILGPESNVTAFFQVGMRGSSSADFNNRTNPAFDWSVTDPGLTNTATMPLDDLSTPSFLPGITFQWTPPNCTSPVITSPVIIPDCASNQWRYSVDITSMGSATSLSFTGAPASPANVTSVPATVVFGPFPNNISSPVVTVVHNVNAGCNVIIPAQNFACPPPNDECGTATPFPAIPIDGTCMTIFGQTATGATQSMPACAGAVANDIWYSFVAPGPVVIIGLTNSLGGGPFGLNTEVFSGNCGSLVSILCDTDASTDNTLIGLTAGNTYYVRVYNANAGETIFFDICIKTPVPPPPPPANDEASGALALAVNGNCIGVPYTNTGATASANEPYPSCSGNKIAPVWFSFEAPPSGAVRISTDYPGGGLINTKVGLFSGMDLVNYTDFQIISCDDDGSQGVGTTLSVLYATGLVGGTTYYIAVDKYDATTANGTFCITVEELSSSHIATAATNCGFGQITNSNGNTTYTGWVPLMDNSSNLIALVKRDAGADAGEYTVSPTITNGPLRTDGANAYYLNRNFQINNPTATNVKVQFFYLDFELAQLAAIYPAITADSIGVIRQAGAICQPNFSTANGVANVLLQQANGISADGQVRWVEVTTPSFSNFYLQNIRRQILPINLLSFAGQKEGTGNKLRWTTANEQNNRGFEVQRSADGVNYSAIGFVNTQAPGGNSSDALSYTFTDNNPVGAKQYYRLKQVDIDNHNKLSNVVLIKGDKPVTLAIDGLYPNPANILVHVLIGAPVRDKVTLTVTDMTGKTVLQKVVNVETGSNTVPVDISRITNGSYLVKLVCSSNCENAVGKFVKQ